jgi:phosphosulfolactate synthase (CoM biosynthesis protein A)
MLLHLKVRPKFVLYDRSLGPFFYESASVTAGDLKVVVRFGDGVFLVDARDALPEFRELFVKVTQAIFDQAIRFLFAIIAESNKELCPHCSGFSFGFP